ncbi:MAG: DUF3098 domain-containing protein [Bacteroidales bacterium]
MEIKSKNSKPKFQFAFTKENYIWMSIGVFLLLLGYIMLVGGGSKDPNTFNYSLFNAQRLIISPILIIGGLVVEVYAIMRKGKQSTKE